ncbi:MAG: ABC transporter substrate-binding protein [Chloroflexi bacterium]|nr:ABC transporter substrate-binding protein [Chloroflexota bacterium]
MAAGSYWSKMERARVSRRRMLAGTGAGAAGLLLAAACGGGSDGDKTPGAGKTSAPAGTPAGTAAADVPPKSGGRYLGVNQGAWGTIDPVVSVGNATGIMPRFYNTLISRSNVDPEFVFYDLAQSFEQPDDSTYIFKIRPGVKIAPNSMGIPERDMDALDAQKWIERIRAQTDSILRKFTEPWVDSAVASGDTFTLKTKGPYAYSLSTIGRALGGCIPPRETYEQNMNLKAQAAGGGPMMIKPGSYQESGSVSLDRNPNYYRKDEKSGLQLPFFDGMDITVITDRQARKTAFLSKQIYDYGAQDAAEAKDLADKNSGLRVERGPSFTFIAFSMNPTRDPWKDDRIRKAALHALDRKQFVDLIVGEGEGKPDGLVHWPTGPFAFNETELDEFQKYDPKMSRELIKAATGSDTIKVKITYPISDIQFHDKHLPIFLKQMKDAGFDVQEDPKDFTGWLGDYTDVKYDASLSLNQIYETPEIALDWQHSKGPAGDSHFAVGVGIIHPEVDEAIIASKKAKTLEDLIAGVRSAQKVAYEAGPSFLPIMSWYAYTNRWNFVKNTHILGDTGTFLSDTWLDL